MFLRQPVKQTKRGFTLTELAIVLAVMGTILGAIWSAAAHVHDAQKGERAEAQVIQILNNYRSLYAQHGVDVADWTDVTCTGVNANYFPADMANSAACVTNTASTYPVTPWTAAYAQVWGYQSAQGIIIGYIGLSQSQCINFANNISTSPDIIWENINGTSQWLSVNATNPAYTATQISADCGASNTVQFMFKAR